jgi:type 1 fimbria pilin
MTRALALAVLLAAGPAWAQTSGTITIAPSAAFGTHTLTFEGDTAAGAYQIKPETQFVVCPMPRATTVDLGNCAVLCSNEHHCAVAIGVAEVPHTAR